jgi:hypothetical protein
MQRASPRRAGSSRLGDEGSSGTKRGLTPTTRVAPPGPGHRSTVDSSVTRVDTSKSDWSAKWFRQGPSVTRLRSWGWGFESFAARQRSRWSATLCRGRRLSGRRTATNCHHVWPALPTRLRPQSPISAAFLLISATVEAPASIDGRHCPPSISDEQTCSRRQSHVDWRV